MGGNQREFESTSFVENGHLTTEVQARGGTAAGSDADGGQQVADVFVVFGITGDLAKVMTFHSLYRLEQRGLLTCPIVGVAVSDWSLADLREHARSAIEDRLLLVQRKCGAAGGAIVGGLRRSRPDERNSRRVHACD